MFDCFNTPHNLPDSMSSVVQLEFIHCNIKKDYYFANFFWAIVMKNAKQRMYNLEWSQSRFSKEKISYIQAKLGR